MNGNPAAKQEEARATSGAGFEERDKALDELIDLLLKGEEYPRKTKYTQPQINLNDLLVEWLFEDSEEVAELIVKELSTNGMGQVLRDGLRKMLEEHLAGSEWHNMMVEENELDAAYNRECGDD
jgi:hypothetical protein